MVSARDASPASPHFNATGPGDAPDNIINIIL